jgi:hypothetical protein
MKKTKPLLFVCGGLMAIATLYGAIDLANSDSSGQLAELYVEKMPIEKPIKKDKEDVPLITEKDADKISKKEESKDEKQESRKRDKKNLTKKARPIVEPKEIEWESFSRKPINRKFKKTAAVIDTINPE